MHELYLTESLSTCFQMCFYGLAHTGPSTFHSGLYREQTSLVLILCQVPPLEWGDDLSMDSHQSTAPLSPHLGQSDQNQKETCHFLEARFNSISNPHLATQILILSFAMHDKLKQSDFSPKITMWEMLTPFRCCKNHRPNREFIWLPNLSFTGPKSNRNTSCLLLRALITSSLAGHHESL